MHRKLALLLAGSLFAFPGLAAAQSEQTTRFPIICSQNTPDMPAELKGWLTRQPLKAAAKASQMDDATLVVGQGIDATLSPTSDVNYIMLPEKPGDSASFGGLFTLIISQAGTYRVALGAAAWVDIVRDDNAISSITHERGPNCSGIRKMVDFSLQPGRYTLQITMNKEAALPLLVTYLPPAQG